MLGMMHERKSSIYSNTVKSKQRRSDEIQLNDIPFNLQFIQSDRLNSCYSQQQQSQNFSYRSSFFGVENPLMSQDSLNNRIQQNCNQSYEDDIQNGINTEQPIPLIQLIDQEQRKRCRIDMKMLKKSEGEPQKEKDNKSEDILNTMQIDLDMDIFNKFSKLSQRNYRIDSYYVKLQELHGLQRIQHELQNYNDQYCCLKLRKFIVFTSFFIPIIAKYIISSKLFQILMTLLILFNITLYIVVKTEHRKDTDLIEEIISILFFSELGLRMIAQGLIFTKNGYFLSFSNIFDFTVVLLSAVNLYRPDIIIIDISPLRIITLLQYLGDIFDGFKIMITALRQAIKYVLEGLAIVGLFSLFFALCGMFLFQGLFNYRCISINNDQIDEDWIQCNQNACPSGMECKFVEDTPKIPTSFNTILYSYGQILRTITMDDWSYLMFFTIRIFNPWIWIYYVLIIFIVGFFGFNLVIAIVKTHYAEATEEYHTFKEKQDMNKRLLESSVLDQEKIRETKNGFDIAMLKSIGFYSTYIKYYKVLQSSKNSFNNKLENQTQKQQTQPRLLSAKQIINNNTNLNILQKIYQYISQMTLKNLLFPKFYLLDQQKDQINLKYYSDDEYLDILEKLMQFKFSQLSKEVNPNQYQKFTSAQDVLTQNIETQVHKDDDNKIFERLSKSNIPLTYTNTIITQQLNIQQKKPKNKYQIFPLKITTRIIKKKQTEVHTSQDSYKTTRKPYTRTEKKKNQNFTKNMIKSTHKIPFTIIKEEIKYMFIQGYYLNYKKIAQKINQKIDKENHQLINFELLYKKIRLKELEEQIINTQNWSGNDVLDQDFKQLFINRTINTLNNPDKIVWMRGVIGKVKTIRKYLNLIITSKITEILYDLLILINFTFLALYGIIDASIISQVEDITTILLIIETVIKYSSISVKQLSNSPENIFQTLIVILNFIELAFSNYIDLSEQNLRLLRGTKCILFYRCLKYNSMAVTIGHIAASTFKQYIYLTILMFIVILLYAMAGMEVYAGNFNQDETLGQLHSYDNILKAIMTIFNIMTNDDWYGVFVLGTSINQVFAIIYSYSMVIVLNYLTYGLVLAILLDGFGKYLDQQIFQEMEQNEEQQQQQVTNNYSERQETQNTQIISETKQFLASPSSTIQKNNNLGSRQKITLKINLIKSIRSIQQKLLEQHPTIYQGIQCEQSLFLIDQSNKFRLCCVILTNQKIWIILNDLIIIASITIFFIETYYDYENEKNEYAIYAQFYLNIAISLDYILNIIARGLFIDQGAYINSIWQITDIIYLFAFFISYFNNQIQKPILPILLYCGYFRPFNFINKISFLTVLNTALFKSLIDIANVMLTLFSVWIIFGVYGIILYERQFGFCEDKMQFRISMQECQQENKTWINFKHNFDNITMALPTLFTISTFDGWGEMLQIAENSDNYNIGPIPFNSYPQTYVFFIAFCFIGSMFFLSLFTGVLFSNLKANQSKISKQDLTKNQKEFIEITDIITKDIPIFSTPPDNIVRKFAAKTINNNIIQLIFFLCLIGDAINLILFHSQMTTPFFNLINLIYHFFSLVIAIRAIMQYLALGLFRFFDNYWRRFLVILIIIAALDASFDFLYQWTDTYYKSNPNTQYFELYRLAFMLRSLRMLLIFQGLVNIQRLMRVMVYALPFLGKIFFLLIDTMIVFALFGCKLYGEIVFGQVMDEQINFTNIAQAMLTLFKCASGDDWRTIMTDTMHHNPYCAIDSIYCGSAYSQIYFFLFMLLSNYVFLNLFVLGMIEQFESFFQVQNSIIQTYIENEDKIKTIWCKYSPETLGTSMNYKFLCRFLLDLGSPLGSGTEENLWDAAKQASQFKLKCDHHGYIQYNQFIYELFRTKFIDDVFKTGNKACIKQIKQYNKEIQLKLMNYRRNLLIKRSNISLVDLRPNFNILHDYLNVLITFKAWETYSKSLIKKVYKRASQYTEENEESSEDQKNQELQSCHSFLNEVYEIKNFIQQSETDRVEAIKKENNNSQHLISSQSQNSFRGSATYLPFYKQQGTNNYSQILKPLPYKINQDI